MQVTLKKIPKRLKGGTRPKPPHIPDWVLQFLEANHQYASESIRADLHKLSKKQQREVVGHSIRLLQNEVLKRKEKLRNGAVRLIVALLPATFPALEKLLADFRSPLWYEVHFLAFNSLDRIDLTIADQKRVLALVEDYLMNVDRNQVSLPGRPETCWAMNGIRQKPCRYLRGSCSQAGM